MFVYFGLKTTLAAVRANITDRRYLFHSIWISGR